MIDKYSRSGKFLFGIFIFLFFVYFFLHKAEISKIPQLLLGFKWHIVFVLIFLEFLFILNRGKIFKIIYNRFGIDLSLKEAVCLFTASYSANVLTPAAGLSGIALFVSRAKEHKTTRTRVFLINLLFYFINYVSLALIFGVLIIYLFFLKELKPALLACFAILILILALFILVIIIELKNPKILLFIADKILNIANFLLRFVKAKEIDKIKSMRLLHEIGHLRRLVLKDVFILFGPFLHFILGNIFEIIMLYLIFIALKIKLSFITLIVGYSIGLLFMLFSVTPSGIGIVEPLMSMAFISNGIPLEAAAVGICIFRAVTFWMPLPFGVLLMRRYLIKKDVRDTCGLSLEKVDISVVIPAYNEEEFLPLALESLNKQNFVGFYEIIVVDNGSTDGSREVAEKMGATVVSEPHHGVAFARQRGFQMARGDIIASTDADSIVPEDWLNKIYSVFNKCPEISGISGSIELFGSKSLKVALVNIFVPFLKFFSWILAGRGYFCGANFAVRKSAFEKAGGFNKSLTMGEDIELASRVRKIGKILFLSDLKVITSARRYQASRALEIFKFYTLNFLSLTFLKKPYISQFRHIRSSHDFKVTAGKLRSVSLFLTVLMIAFLFVASFIYAAVTPQSQLFGKVYWHKNTKDKIVALTFDDGPNEPYTSEVLKILSNYNIKATFFLIGKNVEYYPETTGKIFAAGHIIANHSYSHDRILAMEDLKTIQEEVERTQEAVFRLTGRRPNLFRPPHGIKSPNLLSVLKEHGLVAVCWSDMTGDFRNPDIQKIVKKIVSRADSGGIIVLHDGDKTKHGSDRSHTVKALPYIIEALQKKGYRFVTVPELII